MFGMSLTELLIIAIIAVIALGPEKLPRVMVNMVKLVHQIKETLYKAKSTLNEELHIDEMAQEAQAFKAQIENKTDDVLDHVDEMRPIKSHPNVNQK